MTVREASIFLGLKVRTVREWIRTGRLKAVKTTKGWNIPLEEITSEEVMERADKGRKHSARIKGGKSMGMLARGGKDTEESI